MPSVGKPRPDATATGDRLKNAAQRLAVVRMRPTLVDMQLTGGFFQRRTAVTVGYVGGMVPGGEKSTSVA